MQNAKCKKKAVSGAAGCPNELSIASGKKPPKQL